MASFQALPPSASPAGAGGWEPPPSLPCGPFDLFALCAPSPLPSFPSSLPLPAKLLTRVEAKKWRTAALQSHRRAEELRAEERPLRLLSDLPLPAQPQPPRWDSGWQWEEERSNGAGGEVATASASSPPSKRPRLLTAAERWEELRVGQQRPPPPSLTTPSTSAPQRLTDPSPLLCRCAVLCCAPLLQRWVWGLPEEVRSRRLSVWDPLFDLRGGRRLRHLGAPAFSLSFQSRVAYSLLELDCAHSLLTSPNASSVFLTFADVSGASEGGGVTEFVLWRRRSCELRARGWGLAIGPEATDSGEGKAVEAATSAAVLPPPDPWRVSSFTSLAKAQEKNFLGCPPSTSVDGFVRRVRADTAGQGVQLLIGASPPIQWPEGGEGEQKQQAPLPARLLRPLLEDLTGALAVAAGVLRPGGHFVYRLSGGLCCAALQRSALLLSLLHLLCSAFEEAALQRTAVRRWGEGEVWLVAKAFRLSQRTAEANATAAAVPSAAPLFAALCSLRARMAEDGDGAVDEWRLGTDWQADLPFLRSAQAAFAALLQGEEADLLRLSLQPSTAEDRIAPFVGPSAEAAERRRDGLLTRWGLCTAD